MLVTKAASNDFLTHFGGCYVNFFYEEEKKKKFPATDEF
jgi:hypothetical protein